MTDWGFAENCPDYILDQAKNIHNQQRPLLIRELKAAHTFDGSYAFEILPIICIYKSMVGITGDVDSMIDEIAKAIGPFQFEDGPVMGKTRIDTEMHPMAEEYRKIVVVGTGIDPDLEWHNILKELASE